MGLLSPGQYVTDVSVVDLPALWAAGKRVLLLDRDNTLVPRDTKQVPASADAWLRQAKDLGFSLCFISNNWLKNVRPDADHYGARVFAHALKPLPFAFWHALHTLGFSRSEALVVGDQIFTDILGGHLACIDTVLVVPQTEVDLAHTLVLRRLEARVLKGRVPQGPQASQ